MRKMNTCVVSSVSGMIENKVCVLQISLPARATPFWKPFSVIKFMVTQKRSVE
jgi:hypothetical protein